MTELDPTSRHDNVVDIRSLVRDDSGSERLNPAELDDAEYLDLLLTYLDHPANRSKVADAVIAVTHDESSQVDQTEDAWFSRYQSFTHGVDSISIDELVSDRITCAIEAMLFNSKPQADRYPDERKALLALLDIRAAVWCRETLRLYHDDNRWTSILSAINHAMVSVRQ